MNASVETTINFLSAALQAMRLESGRSGRLDLFADRLVKSSSEPNPILRDGQLMRWMPSEEGSRLVRPRPPYWNICGRVRCAEIGDVMPVTEPGKISPNGVDSPAPMG